MRAARLITPFALAAFLVSCGGNAAKRKQHEYEVVEEGSASGVTATIQGPGETLPPITGTNADTTTAFVLDTNAVAATTTGAALTPPQPPQPPPPPPEPPPPTDTATTDTAATDTATTTAPPTQTDTVSPPA